MVDLWYNYGTKENIKNLNILGGVMIDNAISQSSLSKNSLGLLTEEGDVNIEATRKLLDFSKTELAKAFALSPDQIRLDRMGKVSKNRIKDLVCALEYVAETFDGDIKKTRFWLNTPNPNLGGSSPKNLIINGRYHKVQKFILAARGGY